MQYSNVREIYRDIYPQLEKYSNDKRLLFDLDLHNILKEIRDVYSEYPEQTICTVNIATVLAYALYWNKSFSKGEQPIRQRELELMGDLVAASVYNLTNSGNITDSTSYEIYVSRWEANETVEFLLRACSLNHEDALLELKILNFPEPIHSELWDLYCTLEEAFSLAYCETESEYQAFAHLYQDDSSTDILIDLAKSMRQPGWFIT